MGGGQPTVCGFVLFRRVQAQPTLFSCCAILPVAVTLNSDLTTLAMEVKLGGLARQISTL